MAQHSKRKGSEFERLVAKKILAAAGEPFDRSDCYRTPLSGGHEFAGASDLVISSRLREKFPFCVECKHRKNFRLEHVFDMVKDFESYHQQVLDACTREGNTRMPMVVIRGNGGRIFACTQTDEGIPFSMKYECLGRTWVLYDLDDLLNAILNTKAAQTAI